MNEQRNLTLRSIVICLSNISVGDIIIVDSGTICCRRKISMSSANCERDKPKPFERADGEPLNVTGRDRKSENARAFIGRAQINVDHLEGETFWVTLPSPHSRSVRSLVRRRLDPFLRCPSPENTLAFIAGTSPEAMKRRLDIHPGDHRIMTDPRNVIARMPNSAANTLLPHAPTGPSHATCPPSCPPSSTFSDTLSSSL
jgi:hypothetical protein